MSSSKQQELAPMVDDSKSDRISTHSSDSDFGPPPTYTEAIGQSNASSSATQRTFTPTTELQIQARGITTNTALWENKPDPIPVFRVQSGSSISETPEYISIRLTSKSNSCALVDGSDPTQIPLNSTIYRWGPGRPPRIRIFPSNTSSLTIEDAINPETQLECTELEVKSRNIFTRTQKIVTPFGKFQWRYADKEERREAFNANSLLILEKIEGFDLPSGKIAKNRIRIAQLVRNDEFRTPGTGKWGAGNGGRLMCDFRMWEGEKDAEVKMVEAFVVAGCVCMLKREADRMRDNTTAAIV